MVQRPVYGAGFGKELKKRLQEVNIFERQLADDGYLVPKYFLYIDKKNRKTPRGFGAGKEHGMAGDRK